MNCPAIGKAATGQGGACSMHALLMHWYAGCRRTVTFRATPSPQWSTSMKRRPSRFTAQWSPPSDVRGRLPRMHACTLLIVDLLGGADLLQVTLQRTIQPWVLQWSTSTSGAPPMTTQRFASTQVRLCAGPLCSCLLCCSQLLQGQTSDAQARAV